MRLEEELRELSGRGLWEGLLRSEPVMMEEPEPGGGLWGRPLGEAQWRLPEAAPLVPGTREAERLWPTKCREESEEIRQATASN